MPTQLLTDPSSLDDLITARDAAVLLNRSYSHIMRLLERGELGGKKLFDRWMLSINDLDAYRYQRYGALRDLAQAALAHPHMRLTARQQAICEGLVNEQTASALARTLGISRQAVHAQVTLVRRKMLRLTSLAVRLDRDRRLETVAPHSPVEKIYGARQEPELSARCR